MKISIVTISFNQVCYLKECIDSVLGQKEIDVEYIVVDPGSTDGSRELIESYGERVITVFASDQGPADGLNKGFSLATGDILGFINSDDYFCKEALRKVSRAFEANPKIDIITGGGYVCRDDKLKPVHPTTLSYRNLLYRYATIFQQGTFFRSRIFRESKQFNIHNKTCWDYELFLEIAKDTDNHLLIKEDLAVFRIHKDSISGSNRLSDQYQSDMARIYMEHANKQWGKRESAIRLMGRIQKLPTLIGRIFAVQN